MEPPRDSNGNVILPFLEIVINDSLVSNLKGVVRVRATDENEKSAIINYFSNGEYVVKSKKIDNGYELKISARV